TRPLLSTLRRRPTTTLFPYTTLFRSGCLRRPKRSSDSLTPGAPTCAGTARTVSAMQYRDHRRPGSWPRRGPVGSWKKGGGLHCRSEEHTSELQSHLNLVCRLLLEKKN